MQALQSYAWPGNIRELENIIKRALILSPGDTLLLDDAQLSPKDGMVSEEQPIRKYADMRRIEHDVILNVLMECNWKIQGSGNAADRLGLPPSTLRWRMKRLGIARPRKNHSFYIFRH